MTTSRPITSFVDWLLGTIDEAVPEPVAEPESDINTGEILAHLGLKLRHYHPRSELAGDSKRHTTVVWRPRRDLNHTLEIATAVCSANDTFSKKEGAQLALLRFIQGQTVHLPPLDGFDDNDHLAIVFE